MSTGIFIKSQSRCIDNIGQPQEAQVAQVAQEETRQRVFFKGLKKWTTPCTIYSVFSKYGKIEEIKVPYSNSTKRNMGYGYVSFEDEQVSLNLLKYHSSMLIGGKTVELSAFSFKEKYASKRNKPKPSVPEIPKTKSKGVASYLDRPPQKKGPDFKGRTILSNQTNILDRSDCEKRGTPGKPRSNESDKGQMKATGCSLKSNSYASNKANRQVDLAPTKPQVARVEKKDTLKNIEKHPGTCEDANPHYTKPTDISYDHHRINHREEIYSFNKQRVRTHTMGNSPYHFPSFHC